MIVEARAQLSAGKTAEEISILLRDISVPENEINFIGQTTPNPTFVPPTDEAYFFTLRTSFGEDSDTDEVTVIASGAVEIGGTLTEDLALKNIQPDESKPDYIVTTTLTVENGLILSIVEDHVPHVASVFFVTFCRCVGTRSISRDQPNARRSGPRQAHLRGSMRPLPWNERSGRRGGQPQASRAEARPR